MVSYGYVGHFSVIVAIWFIEHYATILTYSYAFYWPIQNVKLMPYCFITIIWHHFAARKISSVTRHVNVKISVIVISLHQHQCYTTRSVLWKPSVLRDFRPYFVTRQTARCKMQSKYAAFTFGTRDAQERSSLSAFPRAPMQTFHAFGNYESKWEKTRETRALLMMTDATS